MLTLPRIPRKKALEHRDTVRKANGIVFEELAEAEGQRVNNVLQELANGTGDASRREGDKEIPIEKSHISDLATAQILNSADYLRSLHYSQFQIYGGKMTTEERREKRKDVLRSSDG